MRCSGSCRAAKRHSNRPTGGSSRCKEGPPAMKVMHDLVAYFDRRKKLSRRQLRKLLEQNFVASDAPANMHGLCETVGANEPMCFSPLLYRARNLVSGSSTRASSVVGSQRATTNSPP